MATVLLAILIISACTQAGYWLVIFRQLSAESEALPSDTDHTIVVCYKNEVDNLPLLLSHLADQRHDELVLVDDFSTDGGLATVTVGSDHRIRSLQASVDRAGKKAALHTGVTSSTHNTVILTDADCRPATAQWSAKMAAQLTVSDAVLGYAPMSKVPGAVSTFARYETWLTAVQYLSYAAAGMPYMGVGRNMAVSQAKATPILAAMMGDSLASGDDDLLIQGIDGPIATCLHPDTFVYSKPPQSWTAYISQKGRHMTTATRYKMKHQILLAIFGGSQLLTYLSAIVLSLVYVSHVPAVVTIIVIKWAVQMAVNSRLMKVLDENDLWWKFPLLDITTFVYYMVMTPIMMTKNTSKWS